MGAFSLPEAGAIRLPLAFHQSDVYLELQYRAQHMDAEAMSGLVDLVLSCANDDDPRIARTLTSDDTFERLGKALFSEALHYFFGFLGGGRSSKRAAAGSLLAVKNFWRSRI